MAYLSQGDGQGKEPHSGTLLLSGTALSAGELHFRLDAHLSVRGVAEATGCRVARLLCRGCSLDDAAVEVICNFVVNCEDAIRHIDLAHNSITAEGLVRLCTAFAVHHSGRCLEVDPTTGRVPVSVDISNNAVRQPREVLARLRAAGVAVCAGDLCTRRRCVFDSLVHVAPGIDDQCPGAPNSGGLAQLLVEVARNSLPRRAPSGACISHTRRPLPPEPLRAALQPAPGGPGGLLARLNQQAEWAATAKCEVSQAGDAPPQYIPLDWMSDATASAADKLQQPFAQLDEAGPSPFLAGPAQLPPCDVKLRASLGPDQPWESVRIRSKPLLAYHGFGRVLCEKKGGQKVWMDAESLAPYTRPNRPAAP